MMMTVLAIWAVVFLIAIILLSWNYSRLARKKTAWFIDRKPLDFSEIKMAYFSELDADLDDFARCWIDVSHATCIDSRYLRPDDRFDDGRLISSLDRDFSHDTMDEINFRLMARRQFRNDLKVPDSPPETVREAIYLLLGRNDLLKSAALAPGSD